MKEACLRVSIYFLLDLCKKGVNHHIKVHNPVPMDAKFLRAGHDQYGNLYLVLESEEFKDLQDGDIIPELQPLFEKVNA